MAIEIRVPALGESVTEATVGKWLKKAGDSVNADEPLVELETDKVTVEVNAPASGVLGEIKAAEGTTVAVGAVLGAIGNGAGGVAAKPAQAAPAPAAQAPVAKPRAAHPSSPAPLPPTSPTARCRRAPRHARSSPRRASTPPTSPARASADRSSRRTCSQPPAAKAPEPAPRRMRTRSRRSPRQRLPSRARCPSPCPRRTCGYRPPQTMPRARSACA